MDDLMWFENLPRNCPPDDAEFPSNFLCFRLASQNPPRESDYLSHRELYPEKKFNVNECRSRSLSVFSEKSECEKIKKLPANREKHLVAFRLFPKCGPIQKTGKSEAHYSWWVLAGFLSHLVLEEM
jgi:hypothetical protein